MMTEIYAGIDLGGTSIKAAIADLHGRIIATRHAPTDSHIGPTLVIQRMGDLIEAMLQEVAGVRVAGLGIGVPGLVDIRSGVVQFLPNLDTHWRGIPVIEPLSERFCCPIRVLNDARAATLGELCFGHGQHQAELSMVFISIGTGIGGGVVIDGKLRLGPLGAAGEIGHQTIIPDGPLCGCGNLGCLEAVASGTALIAEGVRMLKIGMAPMLGRLTEGDPSKVTSKLMAEASIHDPAVRQAIARAANYIGIAAANVVNLLHPELIVLGGGVSDMGSILVDKVGGVIRERVGMFPTDDLRIERSLLGDQAGIAGTIALAREAASHTVTTLV